MWSRNVCAARDEANRMGLAADFAYDIQCETELRLVDSLLRHHILRPVKGKVTSGKIKWRGISFVFLYGRFIGIFERSDFINLHGARTVSFKNLADADKENVIQ